MMIHLQQFQQACMEASFLALILSGCCIAFFGLFLWLGGARYAGFVVGLLGAAVGALLGGTIASIMNIDPPAAMAVCAVLFCITAILFKKIILIALAMAIFAFLSLTGYLGYVFDWTVQTPQQDPSINQIQQDIQSFQQASPQEKMDQLLDLSAKTQQKAVTFWQKIREIFQNMKPTLSNNTFTLVLICFGGAIVGFLLAKLLKTLVMSLCCSIVGTSGTIFGVILLVFAKGTPAIDALSHRPRFLPTLFSIMVLTGWFIQVFITGTRKKKHIRTVEETED